MLTLLSQTDRRRPAAGSDEPPHANDGGRVTRKRGAMDPPPGRPGTKRNAGRVAAQAAQHSHFEGSQMLSQQARDACRNVLASIWALA